LRLWMAKKCSRRYNCFRSRFQSRHHLPNFSFNLSFVHHLPRCKDTKLQKNIWLVFIVRFFDQSGWITLRCPLYVPKQRLSFWILNESKPADQD
jgi:hypothetical protein